VNQITIESLLHTVVSLLSTPTQVLLFAAAAAATVEVGVVLGQCFGRRFRKTGERPAVEEVEDVARRRVERADTLARLGPMLGLMGTLIPLGPGLAALGQGNLNTLARAVTVAFDTTVLGLAVGIVGYLVGKLRRRHYDTLLDRLEERHGA